MTGTASTPLDGVLVRFGEIGIKSPPVRRQMVERLRQNLLDQMIRHGVEGDVGIKGSRLWMVGPDAERLAFVAQHTFGVVSASPARRVTATFEAMEPAAIALALSRPWSSFAIRANREGSHPFTSQDVAIRIGSAVFVAAEKAGRTPKVNLSQPEQEIHVDIRGSEAFVFLDRRPGPGGIPMGSQGVVVCVMRHRHDLVAAYFMMRRGAKVIPVRLGDGPSDADMAALARWGLDAGSAKSHSLEAAWRLGAQEGALALVTGDGLHEAKRLEGIPILWPLAGLDPSRVAQLASELFGASG